MFPVQASVSEKQATTAVVDLDMDMGTPGPRQWFKVELNRKIGQF